MTLWFIHPAYLNIELLAQAWKEAIDVRNTIINNQPAFLNDPQVSKILNSNDPLQSINVYIYCILEEAESRGLFFDKTILKDFKLSGEKISILPREILYEINILKKIYKKKDVAYLSKTRQLLGYPDTNLIFYIEGAEEKLTLLIENVDEINEKLKERIKDVISKYDEIDFIEISKDVNFSDIDIIEDIIAKMLQDGEISGCIEMDVYLSEHQYKKQGKKREKERKKVEKEQKKQQKKQNKDKLMDDLKIIQKEITIDDVIKNVKAEIEKEIDDENESKIDENDEFDYDHDLDEEADNENDDSSDVYDDKLQQMQDSE